MSKTVLGKGLGNLMREATFTSPASESATLPANNSPGLAAILRGTKSALQADLAFTTTPQASAPMPRQRKRVIQLSLIMADVVQFGFAAYLLLKSRGHFGFLEVALGLLAVGTGAWLTCLALWLD